MNLQGHEMPSRAFGGILRLLADKPVEVGSSLLMIAAGVALTAAPTSTSWLDSLGSVLASVGGALLSWTAATVHSEQRAIDQLRPRLETLSRHLGTIAAQINQITLDVNNGTAEAEHGLSLVASTTNNLYALVNDVQAMLGSEFDLAGIQATIDRLGKLASFWSGSAKGGAPPVALDSADAQVNLAQELAEIREKLQSAVLVGGPRREVKEYMHCPRCKHIIAFLIGSEGGSSSTLDCSRCGLRFHVHRDSDLSLFHRAMGGVPPKHVGRRADERTESIECAVCHHKEQVDLSAAAGTSRHITCVNCGVGLNIHRRVGAPPLVVRDGLITSEEPIDQQYRRTLKKAGVRFVPRTMLELGAACLGEISSAGARAFKTFQDLDRELHREMASRNLTVTLTDAKKVRQWAFKARIFEPFVFNGNQQEILLRGGLTAQQILDAGDESMLSRLVVLREEPLSPQAAAAVLLGEARQNDSRVAAIVRRINSLWEAGDLVQQQGSAGNVVNDGTDDTAASDVRP